MFLLLDREEGGTLREMTREARLLEGEEKNLRELGKGDSWREEGVKMERAECSLSGNC